MTVIQPYRIRVKVPSLVGRFDTVIGLEIHAQLQTNSKLFCGCSTTFGVEPNKNTCPTCTGMPGVLPVINEKAVTLGIRAALALNMTINPQSIFARKNYFYPDLPKGYQTSQYDYPLASDGYQDISIDGITTRIRIRRAHLEEDAGKLVHVGSKGIIGATGALVDLNRSGIPLLEIVSEPDIKTPEQAVVYLKMLRDILVFAKVTDGNMEEGSLRCDANISIQPKGSTLLGTRVEIKNLNSFKFLKKALEYEVIRQVGILASGRDIVQETRNFDPASGRTISMRSKEESPDYRYFPEPDLLPLEISPTWIEMVRREMPVLPHQKREEYIRLGVEAEQVEHLLTDLELSSLFDECLAKIQGPSTDFTKWFLNVFIGELSKSGENLRTMKANSDRLAKIYNLMRSGEISSHSATKVLGICLVEQIEPDLIVDKENLRIVKDESLIASKVEEILAAHESQVAVYKSGRTKVLGFFIGEVMKALGGKVDAGIIKRILLDKLE